MTAAQVAAFRLSEVLQDYFGSSRSLDRVRSAAVWYCKFLATTEEVEKVVFLMTALEALLGDARAPGEASLTATLSERLAFLIGASDSERAHIREQSRNAYYLRSKILHRGWLDFPSAKGKKVSKKEPSPRAQYTKVLEAMVPLCKRAILMEKQLATAASHQPDP